MNRHSLVTAVAVLSCAGSVPAVAGPYADDLAKCLVRSTTAGDRAALARWIFAAASSHPAVQSVSAVQPEQRDQASRNSAALVEKLLGDSCRKEAQQAVRREAVQPADLGFRVLGEVGVRELFSDPAVTQAMGSFEKYFDKQKLDESLSGK